ncbi:hypothetical protein B0T17DRAFT_284685 [Bombardia bombarda]|uniref:NADH-ubiquinone oxidoreductase B15 subunit n=1 Tax=Bombardia bombarda TaxID=252184 RepID=A0AA39WTI0_9PEZI|nr:hypothetical protein B0T17DRAFT_284685 [Bombardia bombarda]
MAGLKHYKMALDPAIVRLGVMNSNRYKYFRWTKRTAWINVVFVGIIPGIVGYLAYTTDGKWDLRAKRRGDLISEY